MKKILVSALFSIALTQLTAQVGTYHRTINVNGSAEMEVVPDEIYVQVDLREYDKKGAGKVSIETITNKFLAAVKSIGLTEKDISVQGYSGYDQNYWWWHKNKKKENPDMKATVSYLIKLSSTAKMDELVKKMDDEATQNFFIQRTAHSKLTEYREQLKIQAVKNAKIKAELLAGAIGEKVGEAMTINEPNDAGYYPQPRMLMANSVMMEQKAVGDAPPMEVDFKKIKLKFDANVVFALK